MSRESSYRPDSPYQTLSPYTAPARASASAINISTGQEFISNTQRTSPEPFRRSIAFDTRLSLRGGKGGSNDSTDAEATKTPIEETPHKPKASNKSTRTKSVKIEPNPAKVEAGRDSSASDVNSTRTRPAATATAPSAHASNNNNKTSKNKNKRKAATPPPSSSTGSTSATEKEAPSYKKLAPFEDFVAHLKAREAADHAAWLEDWAATEKERTQLLDLLKTWTEVARTRDAERAAFRLETRIEKVRLEEEKVGAREKHRELLPSPVLFWFWFGLFCFVWR